MSSCRARHRHEPAQLHARIAEAGVRRAVEQAVAGQQAVTARAANPIVAELLPTLQVDQFHAAFRQQEVIVGGLAAIAACMVPRVANAAVSMVRTGLPLNGS